jgi:hypothetical protein
MDFFIVRGFREEKLARLYRKPVSVSNQREEEGLFPVEIPACIG